jgi:hypothetical protein
MGLSADLCSATSTGSNVPAAVSRDGQMHAEVRHQSSCSQHPGVRQDRARSHHKFKFLVLAPDDTRQKLWNPGPSHEQTLVGRDADGLDALSKCAHGRCDEHRYRLA